MQKLLWTLLLILLAWDIHRQINKPKEDPIVTSKSTDSANISDEDLAINEDKINSDKSSEINNKILSRNNTRVNEVGDNEREPGDDEKITIRIQHWY